ncbi:coiled-coil domain-containing protein 201-like [Ursus maritimus]|uniref:Coiled-coil domain-containing protein 201-like n=1 Tax=Ursus maritimus TaxID=29073 RepID=A0A8M1GXP3_URSMA|nr:coiled-coil domain-containing protein 201-like [Ursus maritimus]
MYTRKANVRTSREPATPNAECRDDVEQLEVSGLSSSEEDEGPSSRGRQPPLRKVLKHSRLQEASPSLRRRPAGHVPSHPGDSPEAGSPLPARFSWNPPGPQTGLSSTAALQTPRLSNIRASRAASGQPGPNPDPQPPKEDPPARASVTWRRQQRAEARGARSWSPPAGWPGIPDTAQKRKRELKKPAAVMERVRQWEIRLLQDIEEATQHELTIEDD